MFIHVELYGLPRHRAGIAAIDVEATRLGDVFSQLGNMIPQLCDVCLEREKLKPGYLANINGKKFVTDPATFLQEGDTVLIISADGGG